MPREIDCPDCGGKGELIDIVGVKMICSCFGTGKIKVYTEQELQEAIKQETKRLREELLICRQQKDSNV